MVAIIGIVVLMVSVFGSYILHGGDMGPIIKAAPLEIMCILGAGIGGMLVGNSMDIFKGAMAGMGKVFKGPAYHKEDYLSTIFVVSKIMKTLKTEGPVALEAHIENPESSAIFGEYPKILRTSGNHHQARSGHVQAVHGERIRPFNLCSGNQAVLFVFAAAGHT